MVLKKMSVGDSFVYPNRNKTQLGSIRTRAKRLGMKVAIRFVDDAEARVWRVE